MTFSSPFSKLFEEFGQFFDEAAWKFNNEHYSVAINIWSDDKNVFVQAELPGIDPDSLDVSIIKDRLVIKAERKLDIPEQANVHQNERHAKEIERSIQLPFDVEAQSANAEYKNGILNLTIARVRDEKPHNVKVNVK